MGKEKKSGGCFGWFVMVVILGVVALALGLTLRKKFHHGGGVDHVQFQASQDKKSLDVGANTEKVLNLYLTAQDGFSYTYEPSPAAGSVYSCRPEFEFYKSISRRTSSDTFQELESVVEVVTRFELDMACVCEKLANLNLLLMHVEAIENDFEAFVSELNPNPSDLYVKALTFDFLSGFLNSKVTVLENTISDFQMEKASMQEFLSSSKYLGDTSAEMDDMLDDSKKSLQQSMEQLLEIKTRYAMFEKKVATFAEEVAQTGVGISQSTKLDTSGTAKGVFLKRK